MENLFVTASNLYSLRAINAAIKRKQYLTAIVIGSATIGSIIYHLSETKHNMHSLCLKEYSWITLNVDRFLALCAVGYGLWRYRILDKKVISFGSLGLLAMLLSESQYVITLPPMAEKKLYLLTHPIWHVCAFHVAYLLVKKI